MQDGKRNSIKDVENVEDIDIGVIFCGYPIELFCLENGRIRGSISTVDPKRQAIGPSAAGSNAIKRQCKKGNEKD